MKKSGLLYNHSLALLTDLYELTMAYGYWKTGRADDEAVFHLFFRQNPFKGGYAIACGLETAINYLNELQFDDSDLEYLGRLSGNDGEPLFEKAFLEYLKAMRFSCDVDAIPEGTIVFPHEPLIRIQGPLMQGQIIETFLLNALNFQTLIATKASRVYLATKGDPVLEFGLRRAQGIDGALTMSRAAYIGGCAATSNVLAGKLFGIPVRGTHAHSWVMSFEDEMESFEAYARAMPNNCVFLVDTYDTLEGVRRAVEVGQQLRERGHEMVGIRLDSGDLAELSIAARKILDKAGFPQAAIVASNDLDEHLITRLKEQGATISVWGVGTKMATAYDQPALGGVYKLAAIRKSDEDWRPVLKLSEQVIKVSNPGVQQVRRFHSNGKNLGDAIYNIEQSPDDAWTTIDPIDATQSQTFPADAEWNDLLVPIFREGQDVYESPPLEAIKKHAATELARFDADIKRFIDASRYPVGLEAGLHNLKSELMSQARNDFKIEKD